MSKLRIEHKLLATLWCSAMTLAAVPHALFAQENEPAPEPPLDQNRTYAQPGDWATLMEGRDGRNASGTCKTDVGLVAVRLAAHTHADSPEAGHATVEISGRWEPFVTDMLTRDLQVQLEVACGTGLNENVEFFTSSWLPLNRQQSQQEFACPESKPVMLAARCQTSTKAQAR